MSAFGVFVCLFLLLSLIVLQGAASSERSANRDGTERLVPTNPRSLAAAPSAGGAQACTEEEHAARVQIMRELHSRRRRGIHHKIIAAQACEDMARRMEDVC